MSNNEIIEKYLKECLKNIITEKVDDEIEKEVQKFQRILVDRRNQYISEIMKGIQIMHGKDEMNQFINYRIIFENTMRFENR